TETRFVWSIRCRPSRLSRLDACLAIQIDVEIPTDAVTHSPTSSRIAAFTARATPSGPSFFKPGVPARFIDASSIDILSTSGLCRCMISMSLSETDLYSGGSGSRTRIEGKIALASNTRIPVLIPRSRASRGEETVVAAAVGEAGVAGRPAGRGGGGCWSVGGGGPFGVE